MPLTVRHAKDHTDIKVGTLWYRADGRADVCLIRVHEDPLVRVQYLNNRRVFRTLNMGEFREQWVHWPRIDLSWFNKGSVWRRIRRAGRNGEMLPEDPRHYTLDQVRNGRIFGLGHNTGSAGLSVLQATLSFVRLWPSGVTFPETPEVKAKQPRKRKAAATLWDRLDEDLFDDPPS